MRGGLGMVLVGLVLSLGCSDLARKGGPDGTCSFVERFETAPATLL